MIPKLILLHASWCKLTHQELNYRATERLFYDFNDTGFDEDDLRCVIEGMKRDNAKGGSHFKFRLHNVIGDLAKFASLLADFRSKERSRVKPKSNRENVVEIFRHTKTTDAGPVAQSVKDLLRKAIE